MACRAVSPHPRNDTEKNLVAAEVQSSVSSPPHRRFVRRLKKNRDKLRRRWRVELCLLLAILQRQR